MVEPKELFDSKREAKEVADHMMIQGWNDVFPERLGEHPLPHWVVAVRINNGYQQYLRVNGVVQ